MKAIYSTTSRDGVTHSIRCDGKRHDVKFMAIGPDEKMPDGWYDSVEGAVNPKPKVSKKKVFKKKASKKVI